MLLIGKPIQPAGAGAVEIICHPHAELKKIHRFAGRDKPAP
jgi:hypothetical protein